jgi:hypothetical protein
MLSTRGGHSNEIAIAITWLCDDNESNKENGHERG